VLKPLKPLSQLITYPTQLRLSVCPEPQPRDASYNPASSLCALLLCRPLQRTLLHTLGHYKPGVGPPRGSERLSFLFFEFNIRIRLLSKSFFLDFP
jgi:hypothetical protein